MKKFPNKKYNNSNLFFKDYSKIKSEMMDKLDFNIISKICDSIEKTIRNKKIFLFVWKWRFGFSCKSFHL